MKRFFEDEKKILTTLTLITAAVMLLFVLFGAIGLINGTHQYFICLSIWAIAGGLTAVFHGVPSLGVRNVVMIIVVGMLVSLFFEASGANFGWFFSKYTYTEFIPGPKLFGFNVYSMIAYGIGVYLIWAVAQAAVQQYDNHFKKGDVVLIPVIAGALFAAVDYATDPLLATISQTHIWEEEGVYYGIPWQNYIGWYIMAYVIYQVIAIILWAQDRKGQLQAPPVAGKKRFWLCPVLTYGALFLQYPFYALIQDSYEVSNIHGQTFSTHEIYWGVCLVAIGMMVVPTILMAVTVCRSKELED